MNQEKTQSSDSWVIWLDVLLPYWLIFASLLTFIGMFIDANGHVATAGQGGYESPFVPWHYVLYAGFASIIFPLLGTAIINRRSGRPALEKAMQVSLIGGITVLIATIADITFHSIFGFEQNAEGEASPTHLLLIIGIVINLMGVADMGAIRRRSLSRLTWKNGFIVILPNILILCIMGAILQAMSPVGLMKRLSFLPPGADNWWPLASLIAAYSLWSIVVTMDLLRMIKMWELPRGTFFVALVLSSLVQSAFDPISPLRGMASMALAGVLIEIIYRFVQPWKTSWVRQVIFCSLMTCSIAVCVVAVGCITAGTWLGFFGWSGAVAASLIWGAVSSGALLGKFPFWTG
jgi:hypothetical protein